MTALRWTTRVMGLLIVVLVVALTIASMSPFYPINFADACVSG